MNRMSRRFIFFKNI